VNAQDYQSVDNHTAQELCTRLELKTVASLTRLGWRCTPVVVGVVQQQQQPLPVLPVVLAQQAML
jgi:hypothetical protein